jgi:hypothetical protein
VNAPPRRRLIAGIGEAFGSPDRLGQMLSGTDVPPTIAAWLGRLHTLSGVPFRYLVPDEAMLPPESIRFFRLDSAWMEALLDGAFSLGRNLSAESNASMNVDAAVRVEVVSQSRRAAPLRTRRTVPSKTTTVAASISTSTTSAASVNATAAGNATATPWTGFVLRSSVVSAYPGLGVNVYPKGHTPDDKGATIILLPIRRFERLGDTSDTLVCLVEGEAYRVDIHEAPEALHYGIDDYIPAKPAVPPAPPTPLSATKVLRLFTEVNGTVTFTGATSSVAVADSFRTGSPRVLMMTAMQAHIATANPGTTVTSAQMGFEMTEGVGMVSFVNQGAS